MLWIKIQMTLKIDSKNLDKQGIYALFSVTKNDVIRFPAESASNNDVARHNIHEFKTILLVFFVQQATVIRL